MFTLRILLPPYSQLAGLSVEIDGAIYPLTEDGTSGVFEATVTDDLVGTYAYTVWRDGAIEIATGTWAGGDAPSCDVTIDLRSQYGQPSIGATVSIQFVSMQLGAQAPVTVVSDYGTMTAGATGLVYATLLQRAIYQMVVVSADGRSRTTRFTTPAADTHTVTEEASSHAAL